MQTQETVLRTARLLYDRKASDITVLRVGHLTVLCDYLIIASGGSDRQVGALSDAVEDAFEENGITPKSIAGKHNSGWILMDYGDVIVNIFNPELRERYNLENIWGDCTFIEFEE